MPLVSEEHPEEPAAPVPGLLKPTSSTTELEPISVETKEPFVEVKEAKYLHPVTSEDTSEEFLPDISELGKYKYISNNFGIFCLYYQ